MKPNRVDIGDGSAPEVPDMSEDCARRLSCLLDGELGADECRELVERLRHDEDACRRWMRFNCVGDAMRSADVASWHSEGFVARVSAALDKEPTILAPSALTSRSRLRRWVLPGAGAAVAAAILVAVGLPARQTAPPEATAARSTGAPTMSLATARAPTQVDRSPALERYLAAHRELAAPTLMPNSTPYVRTSAAVPPQEAR
jgi:sigma-E factor negative regulatory protein RseA